MCAPGIAPQWPRATDSGEEHFVARLIGHRAEGSRRCWGDAAELSQASAAGVSLSGASRSRERAGERALRGALRARRPRLLASRRAHRESGTWTQTRASLGGLVSTHRICPVGGDVCVLGAMCVAARAARPCPRHSTLAITYIQCFGCPCSALGIALESSGASALHSKCPRSCGTATEDRTGDQAARLAETPARIRLIAHYYRRSGSC